MLRHIIVFRLRECETETERNDLLHQLTTKLKQLPGNIPQIKEYEVGINKREVPWSYDFAVNAVFDSLEDLELYIDHPAHQDFVSFNKDKSIAKAAVDYYF